MRKTKNNGLSRKDQKQLFNALFPKKILEDLELNKIQKNGDSEDYKAFHRVCEQIMHDNPVARKSYEDFIKKWNVLDKIKNGILKPSEETLFNWFVSYSQTSWFRSMTNENIDIYRNHGVSKVQISAYVDDRTTEICLSMNGRIIDISNHDYNSDPVSYDSFSVLDMMQNIEKNDAVLLPPYHFNCRTTFFAFDEVEHTKQLNDIEKSIKAHKKLSKKQLKFAKDVSSNCYWRSKNLADHTEKHAKDIDAVDEFNNISKEKYVKKTLDIIKDDKTNVFIVESNKGLLCYNFRIREADKYNFVVTNLKYNTIISSYIRNEKNILKMIKEKEDILKKSKYKYAEKWQTYYTIDELKKLSRHGMNEGVFWYEMILNELTHDYIEPVRLEDYMTGRSDIHMLTTVDFKFTEEDIALVNNRDSELINNIDFYYSKMEEFEENNIPDRYCYDLLKEFREYLIEIRKEEEQRNCWNGFKV